MDHDIPTFPLDNPAETVMAALAHGMTGHPEKAAPLFEPFIKGGPGTTLSLCASLAEAVAMAPRKRHGNGGTFRPLAIHRPTGRIADLRDMPPGPRFAGQFAAAWGNGQRETAHALFVALYDPEDEAAAQALAEGIRVLFGMAVASMNEITGRTA
jgi:hypothetical protein